MAEGKAQVHTAREVGTEEAEQENERKTGIFLTLRKLSQYSIVTS